MDTSTIVLPSLHIVGAVGVLKLSSNMGLG